MAAMPLPDLSAELVALEAAAGSTIYGEPFEILRQAYARGATVGSAYVTLLRRLFAPLGIAVVDASHISLRNASRSILTAALEHSSEIADRIKARSAELEKAGYPSQVADVAGLSLVFSTASGSRKRIPIETAGKRPSQKTWGRTYSCAPSSNAPFFPLRSMSEVRLRLRTSRRSDQ